jgi:flagellar L-ring protein precursor FlgH
MRKTFLILNALFALSAGALRADSLWPGGANDFGNAATLITDNRALKVGDIVTVHIVESASAEQSSSVKTAKQASVSGGAGQGSWSKNSGNPLTSYGAGGQESFDGGGASSRAGKLVTTLSARVINVLDSGNLVIEGRRSLKLNEEKQYIFVHGVIRPKDVGRNNVVLSSAMSDAQIVFEGKGPLSEKSRPGFFTRLLDWLGIF